MTTLGCLLVMVLLSPGALVATPAPDPAAAPDPAQEAREDSVARLAGLAASDLVRTEIYGTSLAGRSLRAVAVSVGNQPLSERQGLLVVGTLDGRRSSDHQTLVSVLDRVLAMDDLAERLGDKALVFMPVANPDGLALDQIGADSDVRPTQGNRRRNDADRDGRLDEDGPRDLDGDGEIAWMRVPDGEGTWVIDEHDSRALRKARTERGERGTHRLIREGLDDDGDGEFNEDDGSGVLVDRNFPQGWPEHDTSAGTHPLSEPESKALVDWLLAHPGMLGVLVLGAEDTLVSLPSAAKKVDKGGFGGFRSLLDGLLEADVDTMKEWKRRFDETGDHEHEAKGAGPQDGSLLSWSYHQAGRWPLALSPWSTPEELPKPDKKEGEGDGDGDDGAGGDEGSKDEADDDGVSGESVAAAADGEGHDDDGETDGGEDDAPDDEDSDDEDSDDEDSDDEGSDDEDFDDDKPTTDKDSPVSAAVLAWLDEHRGGQGIIPWKTYQHPQLGTVEIGGFSEATLVGAGRDEADLAGFAEKTGDFLVDALGWFPQAVFEDLKITPHGEGLYMVEVVLVNPSVLPTTPQFAADARTSRPIRVRLMLPPGVERLSGPQQVLVRRLDGGGGRRELKWVLAGGSTGTRLVLSSDADTVPDTELEIILP
jgi:hypothetical protein